MENSKATIETLNDLIEINNDRIIGFENATKELKPEDSGLKTLFTGLIGDSHNFKMELATEVVALGHDIAQGGTTSGKLHRSWLDVKAAFSGHSKRSILEECEFGEDAIKDAYKKAIADEATPAYIKDILVKQQSALQEAHDQIKGLRDSVANN
ncbi:PA2169 family four-helix-bundle protein [Mucilaginibacter glaciei]|uniref:PA2169 family four-helix-bundle protein n=1 Tax=Mucilaginibacter glaciei TaxID=2772109 RepID=A0A926NU12_9SPHI|nr:PA2169 family four-helix-bundle protein [Mucilaginibacter glaciei]MBD1391744.1 PA2169 family four-helix-bundle protein [Mucilaginibacter glaciei]